MLTPVVACGFFITKLLHLFCKENDPNLTGYGLLNCTGKRLLNLTGYNLIGVPHKLQAANTVSDIINIAAIDTIVTKIIFLFIVFPPF